MDKRGFLAFLFLCLFSTLPFILVSKPVFAASEAENTWQAAAPLPEAVVGGRAGVVDGKVYVMDGYLNYLYDPSTDTWTARKPMPTPRILFGMAVWQDKIYVISGSSGVDNRSRSIMSNAVEVYDPSADTWQTKQPIPTARAHLQANAVNGQIYLVGGMTYNDGYVAINEVYNIANDSWATAWPAPYSVVDYTSDVYGGKIYIIGGQSLDAPMLNLNSVLIYDCANNSWSFGAPMPNAVRFSAAGATTGEAALRRIYVVGGVTPTSGVLGDVQVYDPQNNSWTFGASLPSARGHHVIAVAGDRLYAIGGKPYGVPYPELVGDREWYTHNEVYTPFGYGTPDPAYVLETTPPKVSLLSPLNQTYNETSIQLNYTVDKAVSWVGYSLDGKDNVTVNGNLTFADLPNGVHNLILYAKDTFGNVGAAETINFTIAKPFPIVAAAAVSVVAAVVLVAGLLIYFKKHKMTKTSQT
jgi:hypothetical protein